jgi:hypothetical protein
MANQTASFTPETNRRFLDQFFFDLHEVLFHCTLKEAARFRVPMAFGEETAIKELRRHASGRFLSAAREGRYYEPGAQSMDVAERRVRIDV